MGIARFFKKLSTKSLIKTAEVGEVMEEPTTEQELKNETVNLLKEKKDKIEKLIDKAEKAADAADAEMPTITEEKQKQLPEEAKMDIKDTHKEIPEVEESHKEPEVEESHKEPEVEKSEEDKIEAENTQNKAFSMRFVRGSSFDNSYYVADNGIRFSARKVSKILPKNIQAKIIKALTETGEAPADIVSPTDILEQLTEQGVNDIDTFDTAMDSLETSAQEANSEEAPIETNSALHKKAGLMAWNESEIPSTKAPKITDAPTMSMVSAEAKAGQSVNKLPAGKPSKVKQYYGRLPGKAGGDLVESLNPQSSIELLSKIDFLRKALDDAKMQNKEFEDKALAAENKADSLLKEKETNENSDIIESMIKDLKNKQLLLAEDEDAAIAAMAKIDKKSLSGLAAIIKLLGKKGASVEIGKKPAVNEEEKSPKLSSVHLPPSFLKENEPTIANAHGFLAKFWDKN